jgi:adenine C2-methylase RlmN of 23S rRNA A2503 and tRNA A37
MNNWQIVKKIEMNCWQTYVADIWNNDLLEFSDVFLPNENSFWTRPYRFEDFWDISDKNKRVITICTMVGCYFNCQFCASKLTYKRNLDYTEIVWQVEFLEKIWKENSRLEDLNESKELNILFTRMWEPLANVHNVIKAIEILIKKYKNIKIWLSTCWWEQWLLELLKHKEILPYLMLQFSVHWTDELTRSKLLWININYSSRLVDLKRIWAYVKEFRKYNTRKVSFNFIIFEWYNYDFNLLKEYVWIEDIYLRLSPLNVTKNSEKEWFSGAIKDDDVLKKEPVTSEFIKKVIQNAKDSWFSYAFAPAIDEEIKHKSACGQALETLRYNKI